MKKIILIAALILPVEAFCDDVDDLSKILRQTECQPVRSMDGSISAYHCEGPGAETLNSSAPHKIKTMELTSELLDADLMDSQDATQVTK